ncbi:DUF2922 domain-containing protein [Virgibacillus sediminis]|uniref:DUF2922 domain-containing protein n=1 Tax=Virgibacillus sediminis TaxID=202260 RepID=A0ABV7A427_9BACI
MKKLELKFKSAMGKIVTYSLDHPVEPADPLAVNAAMDQIIAQNAFISTGGDLIEKHSARVVERNTVDIDLGI